MDIRELLSKHGVAFTTEHHHVRDGWLGIETCPFCKHGNYHFAINAEWHYCNCWSCGHHRIGDALAALTGEHWSTFKGAFDATRITTKTHRPRGKYSPPPGLGPLRGEHIRYLRERFLDADHLTRLYAIAGLGWRGGEFAWRIFLPVPSRGNDGSWTTRAIGDSGIRYLSARPEQEALPLKSLLFAMDLARHAVIVVEGPFDAMRIGPGAVATMGINYSQAQVNLIAAFPVRYVAADNEPNAQRMAVKLCQELEVFAGKTERICVDAKDPGSASDKELRLLRRLLQ